MTVPKVIFVDEQVLFWSPLVDLIQRELGCEAEILRDIGENGEKVLEANPSVIIARKWFRNHSEVRLFMDWATHRPDMVGILVVARPEPKTSLVPMLVDTRAFAVVLEDMGNEDYVELIRSALLEAEFRRNSRAVRVKWLTRTAELMNVDKTELLDGVAQAELPPIRDSLTQLYNQRFTRSHLEYEVDRHYRYRAVLSIVFFDIDNFKAVNDTYGHQVGDTVLQEIGGAVRETIRRADIAGRYGGEEFLILGPQTTMQGGVVLAERLRKAVSLLSIPVQGEELKVTISIGVASSNPNKPDSAEELFRRADEALYVSKNSGKNKVTSELQFTPELSARLKALDPEKTPD